MRPVVAIDFDGTLVDSMPALRDLAVEVVQETVGSRHRRHLIERSYDLTAGEIFRAQLERILPPHQFNRHDRDLVAQVYEERKREVTMKASPFADVVQSLHHLESRAQLWLITSTVSDLAISCLHWHDLWRHFTGCLGPEWGDKTDKLRMIRADWFIGDTNRDSWHAVRAGRKFAGVQRDTRLLADENAMDSDLRRIAWSIL